MGILSRFKDIISSNINAILDQAEDPAKMCDQYIINATNDLMDVKVETAQVIAERKRCERLCSENAKEIIRYGDLAQKAVKEGDEDSARLFIGRKQDLEAKQESLENARLLAESNGEKMKELHDKLTTDLVTLKTRRDTVKIKEAVAKTQQTVNKYAESSIRSEKIERAFARMETKADRMLDYADAEKELSELKPDMVAEAEKKYGSACRDKAIEEELELLKAKAS